LSDDFHNPYVGFWNAKSTFLRADFSEIIWRRRINLFKITEKGKNRGSSAPPEIPGWKKSRGRL